MDNCVCCGRAVPEGRMVCPECEIESFERSIKMDDGIQAQIASVEARCKSNSHRIDELEADNRALHQLATSVEVLATKQEAIEENVNEIKADVKSIKALPGSRWEAVVKGVITAILAGLIGFALAKLGLGG